MPNLLRVQRLLIAATAIVLSSCGGGGGRGGGGGGVAGGPNSNGATQSVDQLAARCAAPRASGTIDPVTGQPYDDQQGTVVDEMNWIRAYVNLTYLWYRDVPTVSTAPYYLGNTVPYVDPTNNQAGTEELASNYDIVDAYFNSQRSPLFTASGKPKDQFHFTYPTTVWISESTQGSSAGFGFDAAVLAGTPPRDVVVAYVVPGTGAATAGLTRGMQFVSVNGESVINGSDVALLNEALFSPVSGKQYTFQLQNPANAVINTVTLTAGAITEPPVLSSGTLPAPYTSIGYILYNAQVATAESELVTAVSGLQSANGGAGITDLVLDLRYNGGGYLDLASELAYMIAGPSQTNGASFEVETFNNKNPFGFTLARDTTPFWSTAQGFSLPQGQSLPSLNLTRVFVLTGPDTCSASEAVINGLRGVGVQVIQVGGTTCGKPYGFYPQDNCSTTYFTIQFEGVNNQGFGAYADGFVPGGTAGTGNDLPGCSVADDFTEPLGDPAEGVLSAALYYHDHGMCATPSASGGSVPLLRRSPLKTNRFLRVHPQLVAANHRTQAGPIR